MRTGGGLAPPCQDGPGERVAFPGPPAYRTT